MTKIERAQRKLWKQFLVIVGMAQPELAGFYEPGWVKDLPAIDEEEPFDGRPRAQAEAAE